KQAQTETAAYLQWLNQQLQERERALNTAQRIGNMGSWQLQVDSQLLTWSDHIFRIFGISRAEFRGTFEAFLEFIHPEDRVGFLKEQQAALAGKRPLDVQHRIVCPNGQVKTVHERAELLQSPRGLLLSGTVQDITCWVETEAQAQKNAALLKIAGQVAQFGGWSVDLSTGEAQWSEEVCAIHDLPSGGPRTVPMEEGINFYAPEWRDRIHTVVTACVQAGTPFDEELQIITAKGRRIWVRAVGEAVRNPTGQIVRIQGAFQNIDAQKQVEQALVLSQRRFRQLADALPQIVFTAEPDGTVDYANQTYYRYRGTAATAIDLRAGDWVQGLHPDDVDLCLQKAREAVMEDTAFQLEYRIRRGDGDYRWHLVTAQPIYDEAGHRIKWYGSALDIHDRRLAEAAAQSLADRLNLTLESISDGFFILDRNWQFTFLNREAERLLQRSRSELLGQEVWQEFPEAVESQSYQAYHQAMETGLSTTLKFFYPPLDTWFDVSAYPSAEGLAVYFRDITEQKATQKQLAQQAALLDETQDAIIVSDMHLAIQFWNRSAERLYGWTAQEALGQSVETLIDEDRETFVQATAAVRQQGSWSGVMNQHRKDGSSLTTECNWTLVRDEVGHPRAMMAVNTDITQRLKLERQLHQSQRLESLGQLTGGIAHDFNNLLTVIVGSAELLTEQLKPYPDLAALADLTMAAAQRGADLTHRLLAFARRQPLDPKVVQVNALLVEIEPLLRRTLIANIDLDLMQTQDLWSCLVDATQLESAIVNLCLNARDAMPDGGKLTIETTNAYLDQHYADQHAEVTAGEYVKIIVSDSGQGIHPDHLSQVFEPFFTTKELGRGTGLGLSMVYGFVKQSGGHVAIYSELGQGTTVNLYLPRTRQGQPSELAPEETAAIVGGTETILVVEDNDLLLTHVERQLTSLGYRVLTAQAGGHALQTLYREPDIDLLFTDVMMPGGMNGPQLAEAARALRPQLKVLYTSGYTENAIVQQGQMGHGAAVLQKPYRLQDLARMVRQSLWEPAP
ncbi:MAG: PAS domain-containing protein, partial [Nodosilinea sp.]